jgi:hypothetical protein
VSLNAQFARWLGARFKARTRRRRAPLELRWRTPWHAWQGASWLASTLLAPPFFVIGVLLLIDAHSDSPYFWPSTMAVVAATNVFAIVDANQRHHRKPYGSRVQVALRYFGISALVGGALFLLLVWGTGVLQNVIGPLLPSAGTHRAAGPAGTLTELQWAFGATVVFCMLSFVHACVLHAWLAFEVPVWYRISRGTVSLDRARNTPSDVRTPDSN